MENNEIEEIVEKILCCDVSREVYKEQPYLTLLQIAIIRNFEELKLMKAIFCLHAHLHVNIPINWNLDIIEHHIRIIDEAFIQLYQRKELEKIKD